MHPQDAEVAVKASGNEVKRFKTPLKVTHSSDCNDEATLELQLSTTVQDLAVPGNLSVGGTDVGAALAATTGGGWFVGGVNENCDDACADVGLVCTEEEWAAHISEMDDCSEIGLIVEAWKYDNDNYLGRLTCNSPYWPFATACCESSSTTTPSFNTAVNDLFQAANGSATASDLDCSAAAGSSGDAGDKRNVCFCHPQGKSMATPMQVPNFLNKLIPVTTSSGWDDSDGATYNVALGTSGYVDSVDLTLTEPRLLLIHYKVSWYYQQLDTDSMWLKTQIQMTSDGGSNYFEPWPPVHRAVVEGHDSGVYLQQHNTGMWVGQMDPGDYTVKVYYEAKYSGILVQVADGGLVHGLQVLVI